jgi:hypothetical protein
MDYGTGAARTHHRTPQRNGSWCRADAGASADSGLRVRGMGRCYDKAGPRRWDFGGFWSEPADRGKPLRATRDRITGTPLAAISLQQGGPVIRGETRS